jgi:hypothetical protein
MGDEDMKNQYFANGRDLFKYDLLLDVLAGAPALRQLTFIPMLTPNDATQEGGRFTRAAPRRRPGILNFLNQCVREGRRDISCLHELLTAEGVEYMLYGEKDYFDATQRDAYFAAIPNTALDAALIFFDPDVGLETGNMGYMRRSGLEKYLTYEAVLSVFKRAARSSGLVIYQHLQRNKRKLADDILAKASALGSTLNVPSIAYITDDDVAFLGLGVGPATHRAIITAFEKHGERHSLAAGELPTTATPDIL